MLLEILGLQPELLHVPKTIRVPSWDSYLLFIINKKNFRIDSKRSSRTISLEIKRKTQARQVVNLGSYLGDDN